MKLQPKALALAGGIWWGACVFLLTLLFWIRGGGECVDAVGKLYLGYSVSPLGALVGLVWGFVDGAISGWILAWLYNTFAREG